MFQYSLADIERLIREDILQRHGHRIIETSPVVTENEPLEVVVPISKDGGKKEGRDGKPGKRRRRRKKPGAFRWTNRPELSVTILAEPDLGALRRVLEEVEGVQHKSRPAANAEPYKNTMFDSILNPSVEDIKSLRPRKKEAEREEEVDIDPTMLPPGADVQMIKQTLQRARLEGETDERPD